jgi:hypothetical protein
MSRPGPVLPACGTCGKPLAPHPASDRYRGNASGLAQTAAAPYGKFACQTPLCGKNGAVVHIERPKDV